jgi:hypothetical protein
VTTPDESAAPRRRRGGQPGNRNALKVGAETAIMRAMRKRLREWRTENRRVLALARLELRLRAALARIDRERPLRLAAPPPELTSVAEIGAHGGADFP